MTIWILILYVCCQQDNVILKPGGLYTSKAACEKSEKHSDSSTQHECIPHQLDKYTFKKAASK